MFLTSHSNHQFVCFVFFFGWPRPWKMWPSPLEVDTSVGRSWAKTWWKSSTQIRHISGGIGTCGKCDQSRFYPPQVGNMCKINDWGNWCLGPSLARICDMIKRTSCTEWKKMPRIWKTVCQLGCIQTGINQSRNGFKSAFQEWNNAPNQWTSASWWTSPEISKKKQSNFSSFGDKLAASQEQYWLIMSGKCPSELWPNNWWNISTSKNLLLGGWRCCAVKTSNFIPKKHFWLNIKWCYSHINH